eukprot:CAMPEP_0119009480 /NCGR_PEP_ID=MMETSP1176-20130426/4392_1 /TAXON_ID=265551 /ORGANISM="Synedropsis recta cf, Strain CCMP1620" /LENGTH=259 /DNA_ID=CAMNT_0006962001 /DNA_START=20 /DNA_END=799 /DNA_ORIENTATION=+
MALIDVRSHIDSTPLIDRCQTNLGWSVAFSARVFDEYCKFVELKIVAMEEGAAHHDGVVSHQEHEITTPLGSMLVPPFDIEKMWRQHILDGSRYNREFYGICGRAIYPDEASGLDQIMRLRAVQATAIAYQARFGEPPSGEVWYFGYQSTDDHTAVSNSLPDVATIKTQRKDKVVTIRVRETSPQHQTAPFESIFRMKARTPLHRVFDVVAARRQRRGDGSFSFRFGDQDIEGTSTAVQLGMVDGDQITAVWRQQQRGC